MGFYSKKYKSFDELPDGATVAIQNDPTNGARSLQLLADNGIIKLRDGAGVTAGVADIVDNPKKLKFVELDAAQLPRSLPDVDAAAVNNNYAVQAGLDPVRDAILKETRTAPWVNIIAVREEDKDKPWVKTFVEAYHSDVGEGVHRRRVQGRLRRGVVGAAPQRAVRHRRSVSGSAGDAFSRWGRRRARRHRLAGRHSLAAGRGFRPPRARNHSPRRKIPSPSGVSSEIASAGHDGASRKPNGTEKISPTAMSQARMFPSLRNFGNRFR